MKTAPLKFTKQWRHALTDYGTALAWSPDGTWLAAASAAGDVALHGLTDTVLTLRPADGQAMSALGFASSGQWLAAAGQGGNLTVWDMGTSRPAIAFTQSHAGTWIDQLAWHPSQNHLAYGIGSQVQIWDVDQKTPLATLNFEKSSALHLAWHPAGDRLAVSGHGGVQVWATDNWSAEPTRVAVPGASLYSAWSPEGRYLSSGNLDRTLTVAEWDSPPPWLMQGFPGKVRQLAWSTPMTKSGAPLVAAACVEGVTVWERDRGSGQGWRSRVLQHHLERVNGIAFQPETLLLASAAQDGSIALWDQGKKLAQTLKFPNGGCSALAWHPIEPGFVVAGTEGDLVFWQQATRSKGFG
ncbi:MAG: WD40 repeat domain-containing protein [Cyanobacteria bacterium]|nr:WD40 repeat domain-containing protein [Cyanobacteriota bacterium]MDA0866266.1 WD40 repeat domain-containing protein [Cyanobacteriota bacterium]